MSCIYFRAFLFILRILQFFFPLSQVQDAMSVQSYLSNVAANFLGNLDHNTHFTHSMLKRRRPKIRIAWFPQFGHQMVLK